MIGHVQAAPSISCHPALSGKGDIADPTSTRALTTAIASGDSEAFAVFYRDWFARMLAEARRASGRDESFCLDVVQDAMLRAIKGLRPVDDEGALHGWVRRTVRSCAYDRLRAESRRRRREARRARGELLHDPAADGSQLEQQLERLRAAMLKLDGTTREALDLRHRAEWTLRALAERFDTTTGAIDGRLRRALAALRRGLSTDGDETHDT